MYMTNSKLLTKQSLTVTLLSSQAAPLKGVQNRSPAVSLGNEHFEKVTEIKILRVKSHKQNASSAIENTGNFKSMSSNV